MKLCSIIGIRNWDAAIDEAQFVPTIESQDHRASPCEIVQAVEGLGNEHQFGVIRMVDVERICGSTGE